MGSRKPPSPICLGSVIEFRTQSIFRTEMNAANEEFLIQMSRLFEVQVVSALDLLGIESPEKMEDTADQESVSELPTIRELSWQGLDF
jgi:hypothetical protein